MNHRAWAACVTVPVLISSCATPRVAPLSDEHDLSVEVPRVTVPTDTLRLPGVTPHLLDPSDGLDITEVAVLAVVNNPQLRATRARAGIVRAELFAAGLLPDPELSLSLEHPTGAGTSSLTNALGVGLSEDLNALLTRGARRRAAQATVRQTDLEILWEEWQVAQQARLLFVRRRAQEQMRRVLEAHRALFDERYNRAAAALRERSLTLDVAAGDLVALLEADTQIHELDRQINQTRHDLNALLGLTPGVKIELAGEMNTGAPDGDALQTALAALPERRPDLLALRAGYESQSQRLRQAILNQFPAVSVGITRSRDTDGLHTVGVGVTLSLPLFDRNRGNVAIERVTCDQLRQEWQARLDQAHSDVHRLWEEMQLLETQLAEVHSRLPELDAMVDRARRAFDAGDLDAPTYLTLEASLLDRRVEGIQLESSLMETLIALETLMGRPLPVNESGCMDD